METDTIPNPSSNVCCVMLFFQSFPLSLNYKCGYIENLESGSMVNIMVAVKVMAICIQHPQPQY